MWTVFNPFLEHLMRTSFPSHDHCIKLLVKTILGSLLTKCIRLSACVMQTVVAPTDTTLNTFACFMSRSLQTIMYNATFIDAL